MAVLVVSGTRDLLNPTDAALVRAEVGAWDGFGKMFVGCARGVDAVVREEYPDATVFYAEWSKRGKSAGHVRNFEMLSAALRDSPGEVVLLAFPDRRHSPGTWNCIQTAVKMGIEVHIYPVG